MNSKRPGKKRECRVIEPDDISSRVDNARSKYRLSRKHLRDRVTDTDASQEPMHDDNEPDKPEYAQMQGVATGGQAAEFNHESCEQAERRQGGVRRHCAGTDNCHERRIREDYRDRFGKNNVRYAYRCHASGCEQPRPDAVPTGG